MSQQETAGFQDHMDAQQIVLDTDPEAASTDNYSPEPNKKSKSSCCCCNCCCCRLLIWYLSPITCGIGHSILCLLYHAISFGLAIAFFTFDVTAISTSLGLIGLCCVGIPLLWITFEIILLLSRIDLGIVYYMVEQSSKINEARKHLLTLSLYFRDFPLCCCWNRDGSSMYNVMLNRMKYLFTSSDLLCYISYQIFIKPINFVTWCIIVIVGINAALLGVPVWYFYDDTLFKENKVYIGYNPDCDWSDDGGAVICDKNYWWIINSWDRAMYVAVAALLVLPLTVRFSNYLAYLNKVMIYRFYTYYYTNDESIVQDKASLLSKNKSRINSV